MASSSYSSSSSSSSSSIVIPPNSIKLQYLPSFLSAADCESLIALAERIGFGRSMVGLSNATGYVSSMRTSYSSPSLVTIDANVVDHLILLVSRLTGASKSCIGLGPVRYQPGQQFQRCN
jgi:hypothetical protein